ncbi:MAG: DHH family phosphoesterase [Methanomassiliicoccales archaeon]
MEEGSKAVLLHGNADPDALGSAYAICRAYPGVTIVAPGGMDRTSKLIGWKLGMEVKETCRPENFDLVVILDTSSPDQVNLEVPPGCVVIDHHARTERWEGFTYYCDDARRSCAEIVYEMLKLGGKEIDYLSGLALLAGMLTDSGHFRYANPALLRSFGEVMEESGVEMDEVLSLTEMEQDLSERISQLKGGQRLVFDRVGENIVAVSHGSSYESSVCRSLIQLGSDVAFVGSQRERGFRISARARLGLIRQGFHLGRLLEELGMETDNNGGGHAGAAGMMGTGDVEAMLHMCKKRTMNFFRSIKG